MFVKNINGTSKHNPPAGYSSWLEFWEDRTNLSNVSCSSINCGSIADVGAHIIRTDVLSNNWYIIPLCISCNNKSSNEIIEICDNHLVSVVE